jgi:hypothetical protein
MPSMRALLLVLIASLFAFSGVARAAPASSGEPPCHQAPAQPGPAHHDPGKAMAAVNCCVGCMPAPQVAPASPVALSPIAAPAYETPAGPLSGLAHAPDPRPPRLD